MVLCSLKSGVERREGGDENFRFYFEAEEPYSCHAGGGGSSLRLPRAERPPVKMGETPKRSWRRGRGNSSLGQHQMIIKGPHEAESRRRRGGMGGADEDGTEYCVVYHNPGPAAVILPTPATMTTSGPRGEGAS